MRRAASINVYRGNDGRWYWSLQAPNYRTVADGSEGYASRRNATRAAKRAQAMLAGASMIMVKVRERDGSWTRVA